DVIIRGQFFMIQEHMCRTAGSGADVAAAPAPARDTQARARIAQAAPSGMAQAGLTAGALGNAPSTEVLQLFGPDNRAILVQAMQADQVPWSRHDPGVVSWLLTELTSAYGYMRDQAHRNNPLFQRSVFEQVSSLVLQRRYESLRRYRDQ